MKINAKALEQAREFAAPRFEAKASPEASELWIYDAIGEDGMGGISAKTVGEALKKMAGTKSLTIRINSPGGSAYDGVAIFNLLRAFKGRKTVIVDGLAASAASMISQAGDEVVMGHGSQMMIHEAWGMAVGNADDLREKADVLEKVTVDSMLGCYARTGLPRQQLLDMMKAETWLSATEAVALHFADRVEPAPASTVHNLAGLAPRAQSPAGPVPVVASIQASATSAMPKKETTMNPLELLRNARASALAEIETVKSAAKAANRVEFTTEESEQMNGLFAKVESLDAQIALHEKSEKLAVMAAQPVARQVPADNYVGTQTTTRPPITGGTSVSAKAGNWGFTRGFPEFLNAVRDMAFGKTDARIHAAVTTYGSEVVGADGGMATPADFSTKITEVVTGEESLVGKFSPVITAGNQLVLPTDETTPYGTSGIYAEWLGEAGSYSDRKPALNQVTVTLQKVGCMVQLSEELASDAPAIQSHVLRKTAAAIAAKVNEAIVNGDGVSKPLGLNKAPGIVTQAKSASGSTVIAALDVANMLSRMIPESVNNCFWLCHSTVLPKLWTLSLSNMPIYATDFRQSPYGTLLGRPVYTSEFCQDYNTAGDIMLVSPDGYVVAIKSGGVETAASIHWAFSQQLNSYRATMRVGGVPLAKAVVARKNGSNTLSHIINLQARS